MEHGSNPAMASIMAALIIVAASPFVTTCYTQNRVDYFECNIQSDNEDYLIIFSDGTWAYTTRGGQPPYGLSDGDTVQGADTYARMDTFGNPVRPKTSRSFALLHRPISSVPVCHLRLTASQAGLANYSYHH
jgi:hypothetical protein